LDGIPLALQLAAVLPGSPSLDQLNQRLGLTNDHSDFRVRLRQTGLAADG
jgi:hypothetical protein